METEKNYFFTDDFYSKPELTLEVMNELVDKKLVADRDMYQNGEFLFMEVYDNENSREILSKVIADIPGYIKYNNEDYASDADTEIGISALHDMHTMNFKGKGQIFWDKNAERFVYSNNMPRHAYE